MGDLEEVRLIGTTDDSGDATINANGSIFGTLHSVRWVDDDLADGVDAVLSMQSPTNPSAAYDVLALTNANSDANYYPVELAHDNTGATLPQGADKTAIYKDPLLIGTPRLVISSGGDTKTGGCFVYYWKRG